MFKLSNGLELSDICYGSAIVLKYDYHRISSGCIKYWAKNLIKNNSQLKKDITLSSIVKLAMKKGCNMFDTSRAYAGSEYVLGRTLSKYKRDSYCIVTKLCNADQYKKDIRGAFEKSLSELGVDYIDLYLMHWPVAQHYEENWKEMEKLYEEGLCKAIGVCNFNIHHIERLKNTANIMPMVNQFECHPLFTQNELRTYCNQNGIQVMSYTSTGRMDERLMKTYIVDIANKYNKSVAQIILKWHNQINCIPIVNTCNKKHLIDNLSIDDFCLTEDEIFKISNININSRLRYDPDNCDFRKL